MNQLHCILGSGPAAAACAARLLAEGRQVVMIDPGRQLPGQNLPDPAASFDPVGFVARMRAARGHLSPQWRQKKLPFASPYIYEDADHFLPVQESGATLTRTLAKGGLSAVWGATAMPMSASSFHDWPITAEDMAPFYRSVAEQIDITNPQDELEKLYPNYGAAPPQILSAQGAEILSHLVNHRTALHQSGIRFGRSRNAIGNRYAATSQGCVNCGLCLYGCPQRAIFSAAYLVETLQQNPNFIYRGGWMAEGFAEPGDHVDVRLRRLADNTRETLTCARLYIACGAATSVRLVADALRWYDHIFYLQDTQQFSIPALLYRRVKEGPVPQAVALSQLFLEMNMDQTNIHLQLYGYNPFIFDLLRARWGILAHEKRLAPLLDRLTIIMGYLPGNLSGRMRVRIAPSTQGLAEMTVTGEPHPQAAYLIRSIGKKLAAQRKNTGLTLLLPLTEIPPIGTSVHIAGSLPMRAHPGIGETDASGKVFGLTRTHVVDASVFPSLPSEHLTYTIMANAARIAARSTREAS